MKSNVNQKSNFLSYRINELTLCSYGRPHLVSEYGTIQGKIVTLTYCVTIIHASCCHKSTMIQLPAISMLTSWMGINRKMHLYQHKVFFFNLVMYASFNAYNPPMCTFAVISYLNRSTNDFRDLKFLFIWIIFSSLISNSLKFRFQISRIDRFHGSL